MSKQNKERPACMFGIGTADHCAKPSMCKWGEFWFCNEHGGSRSQQPAKASTDTAEERRRWIANNLSRIRPEPHRRTPMLIQSEQETVVNARESMTREELLKENEHLKRQLDEANAALRDKHREACNYKMRLQQAGKKSGE